MPFRGFLFSRHLKYVVAPRRQIQVESVREHLIAIADVDFRTHQVPQAHCVSLKFIEWNSKEALALVGCVIHDGDEGPAFCPPPGEANEAVPGPVPVPRGGTFQQSPLTLTGVGMMQTGKNS